MIIQMNDRPHPYTEISTDFQLKIRLVECKYCKYATFTGIPNPKCSVCHHDMITVIVKKEI